MLFGAQIFRILKLMDSHHLVVRLVVAVYTCVNYVIYYMTLAAQDMDIAIGTFNAPV